MEQEPKTQLTLWDRMRNLFRSQKTEAESVPPPEPTEQGPTIAVETVKLTLSEAFETEKRIEEHGEFDLMAIEFVINKFGEYFEKKGKHEGAIGLPRKTIINVAETHVRLIQDYVKTQYKGKLERLKVKAETAKEIMKVARSKFDHQNDFLEQGFYNPRKYSILLALLYLFFAFCLIVADIPLALKLTQEGFNLNLATNAAGDISQLIYNPLLVFAENWEVFILAMGIAFCTIYIKILYDEYLGTPLSRTLIDFRKIEGMKQEEVEAYRDKLERASLLRTRVKLMVLGTLLLTILCLGIFRYFNDPDIVNGGDIKSIITGITFILITLIFPIIGGICFSLGLENLQNYTRKLSYQYTAKRVEKRYQTAQETCVNINEQINQVQEYLTWVAGKEFFEHYTNFFLASYDQGYAHGAVLSDQFNNGHDPYARAEKMRNLLLSRRGFEAILDERGKNAIDPLPYYKTTSNGKAS
ncbi:MAG: hypothetical protein AAFR61_08730 [Bacteroidota bacterium]